MKLITFQKRKQIGIGVLQGEHIVSVADFGLPTDMITLLRLGKEMHNLLAFISKEGEKISLADVRLLPPVLRPSKVIGLGRNYAEHAQERGANVPQYPMLFHKTAGSLTGSGAPIILPDGTDEVDYEGELAIIIGKRCKAVTEAEAPAYIGGYTIANDVTARDWQKRTSQFATGKMVDTFCPLGPVLVTADEINPNENLRIQTFLNDQLVQDGQTEQMIFKIPFIISYISQFATLEVGDVILTGTPAGVGASRTPPLFLKKGDEVRVEIERIGVLRNPVQ